MAAAERTLAELNAERQRGDADIQALERRLAVIQAKAPSPSGNSEASRTAAVQRLRLQARLLCAAAQMLLPNRNDGAAPAAEGLSEAVRGIEQLDPEAGEVSPARAAAVREACSQQLAKMRERQTVSKPTGHGADALLRELSQAVIGAPRTDERGIVVTLRELGTGRSLSEDGRRRIARVAAVAKQYPAFPVLVVTHQDQAADVDGQARYEALGARVVEELRRMANTSQITSTVAAGAALPLLDPDSKYGERNRRIEVVFVSPHPL